MKKTFAILIVTLALVACVDTTGLSKESSRTPKGNPNAAVVVTEFADLQCPACQAAHMTFNGPLLEKYGNKIRFDFMHFPLQSLHRYALDAAMAAECAADQGKFWEFVDTAYVNQKDLSRDAIKTWAENLQLDMDLFNRCTASKIKKDTILDDYETGKQQGVGGTPTYFVNGVRVETDAAKIGAKIEEVLQGAMQRL